MADKLLGVKELADILGVKKSWIYQRSRLKGPGTIPRLKLGKYLRFRLDEVMEWIRAQNEAT